MVIMKYSRTLVLSSIIMTARVQDCPAAADGPRPGRARRRARPPAPPLLRRRRHAGPGRGNLHCGANTCLSLHFQCEQYEHLLPEQVKEDDLKDVTLSNLREIVDEKSNCTEDRKLQRQSGNIDQVIHIKVKEMERKEVILGTGMLTDP